MKIFIRFLKNQFATVKKNPILVLGNQKSGTSVIAHLLADFGALSKTIDIPPLWPPVGFDIIKGKIEFTDIVYSHKSYFSTGLIKEPIMTFFSDQVLEVFPNGKYVFIIRDPRDNIRSLLNRRKLPGHLKELEEIDIRHLNPLQKALLDKSVWGGERENYIGVQAFRWNKAVDNYLRYQDAMFLAKYENFMANKEGFIAELAEKLGIKRVNDISEKVDIHYQPRGNHKVSWEDFFGKENLARIEEICNDKMEQFGYKKSL